MARVDLDSRSRSLSRGMAAAGMSVSIVLVLWVTAAGAAPRARSTAAFSEKCRRSALSAPGEIDPKLAVREVQRNRVVREEYGEEGTGCLEPQSESNLPSAAVNAGGRWPEGSPVPADEVGLPFQIGGDPVYGPLLNSTDMPAIAFDGTNFLVVWEDTRDGSFDIYGARVSGEGVVLDSSGIAISTAARWDERHPVVGFDGTQYFVVWADMRGGSYYDIYGARVSTGGEVIETTGVSISTAASDQCLPALAFDGTNYLVVWQDDRNDRYSWDAYGARVSPDGLVLDPDGIPICRAADIQLYPSIAFGGTNYLVVWEDRRSGSTWDIYGARVSVGGSTLDPDGLAISAAANEQYRAAVASDGTDYFVVWADGRSGTSLDIYGSRVSAGGVVADSEGICVSTASGSQAPPALAYDGTNYLAVWYDTRNGDPDPMCQVYGARVGMDGVLLDPNGIAISTAASSGSYCPPAVAFGGISYLVAWGDEGSGSTRGTLVDVEGSVPDPGGLAISIAANGQYHAALSFDGTNYLVVWEELRDGSYVDIFGTRVSADGTVLDPQGIAISTAPGGQSSAAVAFDGTNHLVVWADSRNGFYSDIYAARVSVEGGVLDSAGICISRTTEDQVSPDVVFDGTDYLVVWADYRIGWYSYDVYGARVTIEGGVLDPGGILISSGVAEEGSPSVATDGTNSLVVWEDYRNNVYYDIYGARVSVEGAVLDPAGIPISRATGSQNCPDVAFGGEGYLVVWQDRRGGTNLDIYGARVGTGGSVLDTLGIAISAAAIDQWLPAVAFDGTNYLAVWQDDRMGLSHDIYAARVTPGAEVVDPEGLVISTAPHNQHYPAVSAGTKCTALIAYMCFTPAPYGSNRIWGNIWKGPTAIAFACASATAQQGRVVLSWQMGVEAVASSFLIERSESPNGQFVALDLPISKGSGFTFSCIDCSVQPGRTYWYRIVLGDASGGEAYGPIEVHVYAVPTAHMAYQSYPNPFNPSCTIRYDLPSPGRVRIGVFNAGGSLVRTLADGWREPGVYNEVWDGRDSASRALPSGVYFYRLEAGDFVATRKMVLLR